MPRATDGRIRFVIKYEDGTTAIISVDSHTVRLGDHAAHDAVYERQRAGLIPKGKIKSIERA